MAETKRWDGKSYYHDIPDEEIDRWNMRIDEEGNVLYTTQEETPREMTWCPASQLSRHMHHLGQIAARR